MIGLPIVVGMNHSSAPFEVRESLALGEEEVADVLASFPADASQGAILSTCNRTELYAIGLSEDGLGNLHSFFGSWRGKPASELSAYTYAYSGPEAARHLFRVASGLDSVVVGEAQILGQVTSALKVAEAAGVAGKELRHLFTYAVRAGRKARTETAIGRSGASIPGVAVELAREALGSLSGRRVMIVGAGKAGELSARALLDAGASHVLVANRTEAHSQELARSIGGTAISLSALPSKLAEVDVVITGTGAREPVITSKAVQAAVARRNGVPILLVDVAVPRDVEPSVAAIPGVRLYNMDQIQEVAQANLRQRRTEVAKVDSIVDATADLLMSWWRSQSVLPTIKDLGDTAETVRQQEVSRAVRKLPHLSDEDIQTVEKMSQAIVKKLLHHPLLSLKETPEDSEFTAALRRAFNLREEDQDGSI